MAWLALLPLLFLVFYPSFDGGFLLDDYTSIQNNGDIREVSVGNLVRIVRGHSDVRALDHHPVSAVSFLVDYQWTALDPFGYRISNVFYHWLASGLLLLLMLEVWRLRHSRPQLESESKDGIWFAASLMFLWAAHPFATMTVSYITGRQETLLIGFSLLSMLALLRGWHLLSYSAAMAAFLCKEVAVTLPASLYLLDWCRGGEGIRETFRNRWRFYLALTGGWLLLCAYHLRGGRTHEIGAEGPPLSTAAAYFKAQCGVILNYVARQFWPSGLEFYPFLHAVESWTEWVPALLAILVFLGFAIYSLRWSRWLAFALVFPLLVLSPTSSVIPIPFEPAMDYRMYMPSIGLWAVLLSLLWRYPPFSWARVLLMACLVISYATVSHRRSYDFRSPQTLAEKDLAINPRNLHAFQALAGIYSSARRFDLANQMGWKLVDWSLAQKNKLYAARGYQLLGANEAAQGHQAEAKRYFERAVALSNYWPAVLSLARIHVDLYELDRAEPLLRSYLEANPQNQDGLLLLYELKMSANRVDEAEKIFEEFMRLFPERHDLDVQRTRILQLRRKLNQTP